MRLETSRCILRSVETLLFLADYFLGRTAYLLKIMPFLIVLSLLTFGLSLIAVNDVRQRFRRQFLDIPNHRSSHQQPTPRGGGLGFIFAAIVGLIAYHLLLNQRWLPGNHSALPIGLWLSLLPLIVISLIDDWKSLKASIRYTVQLGVATGIVAQAGVFPQPWLQPLGSIGMIIAFSLTVIGLTALINFYNFMDGLDGLVAGVSCVQLGFCAIVLDQPILWIIVAAVCGFLRWNWFPAKIFMGDAGSTVLGAMLAMVLLYSANHQLSQQAGLAWSYLAISLPLIADAIYTLIRRAFRRENIFQAHRMHLYQRLNQTGWSHSQVAIAYVLTTCGMAISIALLGNLGAVVSTFAAVIAIFQLERYLARQQSIPSNIPISYQPVTTPLLPDRE
jgi:Fuc2NAc and GlcNAc transferase